MSEKAHIFIYRFTQSLITVLYNNVIFRNVNMKSFFIINDLPMHIINIF